jgi:hypothetical protein
VKISAILALICIVFFVSTPAYAYVDPGTGGMLIQLVTGGVAGLLILARLYWRRAKDMVLGKRMAPAKDESEVTASSSLR